MKRSTKYLKIFCNLFWALIVLLGLIFLLPKVILFFMPFVAGFLLSRIAYPMVQFLEKRIKINRKYGTMLIIVLVIAVVAFFCYCMIAVLLMGLRGFIEYLPTMSANAGREIEAAMEQFQSVVQKVPFLQNMKIMELETMLGDTVSGIVTGGDSPTITVIGEFAKGLPDLLVSSIMGLLSTYFFVAERDKMAQWFLHHSSDSFREKTMQTYSQMLKAVGCYFKAQFQIMGVIYVILTIGLVFLRVKYAWLIGFGIAFVDMLPVFGAGTVLVPWAAVKFFSGSYTVAAGMIVLYVAALLVHQLVQPKLIGESVGLNPFATLFFMYIGYQFAGVLGLIVAIPIGMLVLNFYRAGAFDSILWCFREISKDFNEFRKIG